MRAKRRSRRQEAHTPTVLLRSERCLLHFIYFFIYMCVCVETFFIVLEFDFCVCEEEAFESGVSLKQ